VFKFVPQEFGTSEQRSGRLSTLAPVGARGSNFHTSIGLSHLQKLKLNFFADLMDSFVKLCVIALAPRAIQKHEVPQRIILFLSI